MEARSRDEDEIERPCAWYPSLIPTVERLRKIATPTAGPPIPQAQQMPLVPRSRAEGRRSATGARRPSS